MSISSEVVKTVLELDLADYSDIARVLEENLNVQAVKDFEDQIQSFVHAGLNAVRLRHEEVVFGRSGDNAIILFDDPVSMHGFARSVHETTLAHNGSRSVNLAKRWFRMGAATGNIRIERDRRIVGVAISRAVRLEAAAGRGQLAVDLPTYAALPPELQAEYGAQEEIHGKRDEVFAARRCSFIAVPAYSAGTSAADPSQAPVAGSRASQRARPVAQPEIGLPIAASDMIADLEAAARDTVTVVGRSPRLDDLRKQRFRERPEIFDRLTKDFKQWWNNLTEHSSDRLRIYWIDGRSGDGKSVLLLQLAHWILEQLQPCAAVLLKSPDDLPSWLSLVADGQLGPVESSNPALAFVDDLHAIGDLHTWEERLRGACQWGDPPPIGIVASGPTIDREILQRATGNLAAIHPFNLPHLTESEFHEFRAWYTRRTGKEISDAWVYHPNILLVEAIFELVHNESMHDFSKRFAQRMSSYDLLETTKQILAINALQLPATPTILTTDKQRDLFRRLTDDDQLHFEELNAGPESFGGIRFGHPQISLRIYAELLPPHAISFSVAWARDIAANIGHCLSVGQLHRAGTAIVRLAGVDWQRFSQNPQLPPTLRIGSAEDALDELYRKLRDLGRPNQLALLPYWLDAIGTAPHMHLAHDVLRFTLAAVQDPTASVELPRLIAGKLWLLAEVTQFSTQADAMRAAACHVLLELPWASGNRSALATILSRTRHRDLARELFRSFVASGVDDANAYWLLNVALANFPADPTVREQALSWLETYPNHEQAHVLLATLVTRWYADEAVRDLSLDWVTKYTTNRYADNVISCLLASWPKDAAVMQAAIDWLDRNPLDSRFCQLLTTLIARSGEDHRVRKRALAWLLANGSHPFLHLPLGTLLARWPADRVIRDVAIKWIEQQSSVDSSSSVCNLLGTLVRRWAGDDGIHRLALDYLDRSRLPRDAYLLLAPLLSKSSRDAQVLHLVMRWLEIYQNDDHADQLLIPLIVNGPGDQATRDAVIAWMRNNPDYQRGYCILSPLVARWSRDPELRDAAIDWLNRNWSDRNADQLLAPLLHRWPNDNAIRSLAIRWWNENSTFKPAPLLLAAIIRTSDGSMEWLRIGHKFVTSPHGRDAFQVILAVLDRSQADHVYINITLELIGRTAEKERRLYIEERFERILTHNLWSSLEYLRGMNTQLAKDAVAAALANGVRRYDKRVSALLRHMESVPSEYQRVLLEGCCHNHYANPLRREAILSWMSESTGSSHYQICNMARELLQSQSNAAPDNG